MEEEQWSWSPNAHYQKTLNQSWFLTRKTQMAKLFQIQKTQSMVRQPEANKIIFSKINNSIRSEAPGQDERIIQQSSLLRLVAVWTIDGEEQTANGFKFQYLKHLWPRGGTCVL